MAKTKQRIKQASDATTKAESASAETASPFAQSPSWVLWCRRLAAAMLGGIVVYVAYHPSDSILVETGDALRFCAMSLILWTLTLSTEPMIRATGASRGAGKHKFVGRYLGDGLMIDGLVWGLAIWMVVAALATCPPGNLRQATNEAWIWVAGAAVLSSARRLLSGRSMHSITLALLAAVATGMAVHALHQEWVSLPRMRAEYLADPDGVLKTAGIDAPRLSARRMIFANRLLDGGPTATFALANSLAAVLMIAVIVPAGLLRNSFRRSSDGLTGSLWARACLVLIVIAGVSALFATRSRSALGACLLGLAWLWIASAWRKRDSEDEVNQSRSKPVLIGIAVAVSVVAAIVIGLLLFGDDEWMAAAPASLEFRLHYWRSTLALLSEHPMMGAGPGGFQSMYLQYRLPIANEAIADPHNFFFETLAAGGAVAGVFLVLLVIACVRSAGKRSRERFAQKTDAGDRGVTLSAWVGYGAGFSLALVWLFALLTGQLPDFEASVFVVPCAVAAFVIFRILCHQACGIALRVVCEAVLVAVMVHLCVSGGWTVPGVATLIWLAVGILCCVGGDSCGSQDRHRETGDRKTETQSNGMQSSAGVIIDLDVANARAGKVAMGAFLVGVLLLVCLRFESIVPVQQSGLALLRAQDAARRGVMPRSESQSQLAVTFDPWAYRPALWRSEFLNGRILSEGDRPSIRSRWREAQEIAIERSGGNPLVQRSVAEQSLHLYQSFGLQSDLEDAERYFSLALAGNPTDLSLVAQTAMVALELGDRERSLTLAHQARSLSRLGNNVVRKLELQHIYVARKVGVRPSRMPVMRSILDQFQDRLGLVGEPVDDAPRSNETAK